MTRGVRTAGPPALTPDDPRDRRHADRQRPDSEDCLRVNVGHRKCDGAPARDGVVSRRGQRTGSSNSIFYDGNTRAKERRGRDDRHASVERLRLSCLAGCQAGGAVRRLVEPRAAGHGAGTGMGAGQRRRFGGDAGNVTVFGQSGGGGKTAIPEASRGQRAFSPLDHHVDAGRHRRHGARTRASSRSRGAAVAPLGLHGHAARLATLPPETIVAALASRPRGT